MGLIWFLKLKKAKMFDDKGEFVENVLFSAKETTFKYRKGSYVIDLNCPSYFDDTNYLWDTRYFFYNIGNPSPKILSKKEQPIINADVFNVIMETDIMRKLNELSKDGLQKYLTFRNIIIVVGGILVYYYISTNGGIGGLFQRNP